MSKTLKIGGEKFGRLTALARSGNQNSKKSWLWNFQCDCGNVIEKEAYAVTCGATSSCGCYAKEVAGKHSYKHGNSNTLEYSVWNKIRTRILDPDDPNYPKYGGKGLGISPEFVEDMNAFYEYLGEKPSDGKRYTVGRIDNSLGYIKGNIRWESYKTQAKNKSKVATNTSGFTGVVWSKKQAVARWYEKDKQFTKGFSVLKYGLLPAFALACQHRENVLRQLIEQGEPYSEKHGK